MALFKKSNGRWTLQFRLRPNVDRTTIALGDVSEPQAKDIQARVEELVASIRADRIPDVSTARWVAKLDDALHAKLAAAGLVVSRVEPDEAAAIPLLGKFLEAYAKKRTEVKDSTAIAWGHTIRCLIERFGATRPLDRITAGEAKDFRRWLKDDQKLAENTVRRRMGFAKQFFQEAVDCEYIDKSPFSKIKSCAVRENHEREFYVTPEMATKVLDTCPHIGWQLVFALARYGGLRCPSEILKLRWVDVLWDQDRFIVHSPKTEHHEGKATRLVPIFPELRPYLEAAWDQAEEGAEFVVTSPRGDSLGTGMERIIRLAGLEPWPKTFQNLRSTRATELRERWPDHKVNKWLGHTEAIARKHYLQVTDDDYRKAAADVPEPKNADTPMDGAKALQKALQICDETPCKPMKQTKKAVSGSSHATPVISAGCTELQGVSAIPGMDSDQFSKGYA